MPPARGGMERGAHAPGGGGAQKEWKTNGGNSLPPLCIASVCGVSGTRGSSAEALNRANEASTLAGAAQPSAAHAVLLVESHRQGCCAAGVAWAASEVESGACHHGNVGGCHDGERKPSSECGGAA